MKRLFLILAVVSLFSARSFSQDLSNDPGILEVATAGHTRHFDQDKEEIVTFWLHKLMLSALYQNLIPASDLRDWQQQATAPTRLYRRYPARATLAIPGRSTLVFDEVLLPVRSNSPDFIYLKRDDTVVRMAKYDPWVYVKLATEAGIPVHPIWVTVERGDW